MGVELYNVVQLKGRKDYVCQLCGERIAKGREHIYESGLYDGSFFWHRRHIHCNALADAFFAEPFSDDEYSEDEIWDYLREYGCCSCNEEQRDACDGERNPYWCPNVIEKLLDGNEKKAALESVAMNREDLQ